MSTTQETNGGVVVATVFEALSVEMSLAAESCGKLDDVLGQIIELAPPEMRLKVMQEAHMVDHLAQHVTALTDFTRRLVQTASQVDRMAVEDALSVITLGAVAERLRAELGLTKVD